ncbi:Rv3654c family TadE-like protein [Nesterenkonia flava]|uniref:Flp pilus-assembly TadE/G-like family protein n=1 Tax=Nesterenkonia flava TaxID=469799 RepID=A0ABU1FUG7_9MICC|nr:Rv3654c family TadE-like protein [Nesterenkonia flava]MDR5712317.1 flp pilus-assembly TadE/G-like family protein [Nesterenkonia flava]
MRNRVGTAAERERGSGTVLALGLISALLVLLAMVYAVGAGSAASTHASRASDLAALAGADAARGLLSGDPCTVAEQTAARNDVTLEECRVGGEFPTEVTLTVSRPVVLLAFAEHLSLPPLQARSTSRAGPPEALK